MVNKRTLRAGDESRVYSASAHHDQSLSTQLEEFQQTHIERREIQCLDIEIFKANVMIDSYNFSFNKHSYVLNIDY